MQVLLCLSLVPNVYYVLSIITITLPLSPANQLYPNKLHSSRVVKRSTRSWTQIRILILHLSFLPHSFTNCNIYISYVIRSCWECYLAVFYKSHFLPLFVKLLMLLVGFELTTRDDFLSIDSNTLPLCHGRLRTCIVICIFMFKFALIFLNSEHNCM